MWNIIEKGHHVPTKFFSDRKVPKKSDEYVENDTEKRPLNFQAMNILWCALDVMKYNQFSRCRTANAIWKLLEVTHKGTNKVKESKMGMLVRDYKLFPMKQNKSISDIFTRFTNIVYGLKTYGKKYSLFEHKMKILDALPKSWQLKTLVI